MTTTAPQVDVNVPRFNQALVAVFTGLAFVAQWPALVAAVFLVLLITSLGGPKVGPFTQLYIRGIRPRIQPDGPTDFEEAAPPRFAQTLGTIFLGLASAAFLANWDTLGWILALIVTALAALAAVTRICVGCIIYRKAVQR
jgi:hypothetical protein